MRTVLKLRKKVYLYSLRRYVTRSGLRRAVRS